MKKLLRLLYWDLLLLHRNQLIVLSLVVAAVYLGLFYLLKDLGALSDVLVIFLFNDPVVTGLLFAGVILLFEKNQHTLQAIKVAPQPLLLFLLSKTIALVLISTGTALLMTFAAHGFRFHYGHMLGGLIGTSALFVLFGFAISARCRTFNHFLLRIIGFLILMALPFLSYIFEEELYPLWLIPSFAGLKLLQGAFRSLSLLEIIYSYGYLAVWLTLGVPFTLKQLKKYA